jgi:hypothetical protein
MLFPFPSQTAWRRWSGLRWSLIYIAAGMALSNLVWSVWYASLPSSPRNHFFHFAWEEYMTHTEPRRPGEMLLVVVANSQGYGWEVDAESIYTRIAERLFTERGLPVRVVNWSIPGARYHDVMMALVEARRLHPSVLLVSLSPHTVADPGEVTHQRAGWSTHLYHRLSDPTVRAALPEDVVAGMTDWRMDVERWVGRFWPMWRNRSLPAAMLAEYATLRPYFERGHAGIWFRFPEWRTRKAVPIVEQQGNPVVDDRRAEALLDVAVAAAPSVVWINMPFRRDRQAAAQAGWPALVPLCEVRGVVPLDWSAAIPDEGFVTAAHLNRDGHRQFAEKLVGWLP